MMKLLSILLAIAALGTGLRAAYKWYKASQVQPHFGYTYPRSQSGETFRRMGMVLLRIPEPTDPELKQMNEASANLDALNEAATLNKSAAAWTAVSVALAAWLV
jgi:hypothetical protein